MKLSRPSAHEPHDSWNHHVDPIRAWVKADTDSPDGKQRSARSPTSPRREPLLKRFMPLPPAHYHSPCLVSGRISSLKRGVPPPHRRRLHARQKVMTMYALGHINPEGTAAVHGRSALVPRCRCTAAGVSRYHRFCDQKVVGQSSRQNDSDDWLHPALGWQAD